MNPQNEAIINSIVKLFKDVTIWLKDVKVDMNIPGAGKRSGTYTVEEGKLNVALGGNDQFSLHVINEVRI